MTALLTASERRVPMRSLLPYLPRLARWPVLAGGVALAWVLTWWRAGDVIDAVGAVWLMRGAMAVGCVAAVFALDDPSRNVTEPLVGSRHRLLPSRLVVVSVTVLAAALPASVAVGEHLDATLAWGLLLEGSAMLALLCALSLVLQRRWRFAEPGQYLVLGVVLIGIADQLTAGRWPLLAGPGPEWADAHWRWAALGVVAGCVLAWQLRDPASRGVRPLHRR